MHQFISIFWIHKHSKLGIESRISLSWLTGGGRVACEMVPLSLYQWERHGILDGSSSDINPDFVSPTVLKGPRHWWWNFTWKADCRYVLESSATLNRGASLYHRSILRFSRFRIISICRLNTRWRTLTKIVTRIVDNSGWTLFWDPTNLCL